jgi:hypothetical protein
MREARANPESYCSILRRAKQVGKDHAQTSKRNFASQKKPAFAAGFLFEFSAAAYMLHPEAGHST